jgi:hypothetical protein
MNLTEEMKKATKSSGSSPGPEPAFCSIEDWCAISGMGRRWTYDAIGRNVLRAVKCGSRTLIDVPHGLAYMRSLPAAQIRPQKRDRVAA